MMPKPKFRKGDIIRYSSDNNRRVPFSYYHILKRKLSVYHLVNIKHSENLLQFSTSIDEDAVFIGRQLEVVKILYF